MASISNTDRMQDSFDAQLTQQSTAHERDYERLKDDYEKDLTSAKKEYNERLYQNRNDATEEIRKLKEDLYDQNGKKGVAENRSYQSEKDALNDYRDEVKNDYERRLGKAENHFHETSSSRERDQSQDLEKALSAQKKSHQEEMKALKTALTNYEYASQDSESTKAEARAQIIQEKEADSLKERRNIVENYNRQIEKLNKNAEERDDQHSTRMHEAAVDSNAKAEKTMRLQKDGFLKSEKDRQAQTIYKEGEYKRSLEKIEAAKQRETDVLNRNNENQLTRALTEKDRVHQDYLKDKKTSNDLTYNKQKAEIDELRTTGDPLKASPYLVEKIQRNSDERNYKQLQEVEAASNRNLEANRTRTKKDSDQLRDDFRTKYRDYSRTHQKEQDVDRSRFQTSYQDLDQTRKQQVEQLREANIQDMQRMNQRNSEVASMQQKRFREGLDIQKDELTSEKLSIMTEEEIKSRDQQREWGMKVSDLHRGYRKNMIEQQDQHELKMTQMRYEFDSKLQNQTRQSSRALDERVKAYEHQLKQQELAFKERERFLTEHYEEELDKVKRSNARLIQKKS